MVTGIDEYNKQSPPCTMDTMPVEHLCFRTFGTKVHTGVLSQWEGVKWNTGDGGVRSSQEVDMLE